MSTPAHRLAARARRAAAAESDSRRQQRKRPKADDRRRSSPTSSDSRSPPVSPPAPFRVAERVLDAERQMSQRLARVRFEGVVTHVYNPLEYAWEAHKWYVNQYGNSRKDILLVGMNPGPWGMAQTGIPFGEVSAVRDWMCLPPTTPISKPAREHPKRPITGLDCPRSEVSGRRLWLEWARDMHDGSARAFFRRYFVHNYCPLLFLEASGRNRTPAQLAAIERLEMVEICDDALREVVRAIRPRMVCGVGGFATERCRYALADLVQEGLLIGSVLHPSPASPYANRGWAQLAAQKMQELLAQVSASEDVWARRGDL